MYILCLLDYLASCFVVGFDNFVVVEVETKLYVNVYKFKI